MVRFQRFEARTHVMIALTTALLAAACSTSPGGSTSGSSAGAPSQEANQTRAAGVEAGIVGTWERETHCEELVSALTDAGLDRWVLDAVAGNAFVPGVTRPEEIADPSKPCDGAVPRTHSHFFTQDGRFGSLDWNGEQVDDGTYELVGEDTFVVSKEFPDVTFHYAVDGDTITFEPEIPTCTPDCFEASWSVAVAYPGETWRRTG